MGAFHGFVLSAADYGVVRPAGQVRVWRSPRTPQFPLCLTARRATPARHIPSTRSGTLVFVRKTRMGATDVAPSRPVVAPGRSFLSAVSDDRFGNCAVRAEARATSATLLPVHACRAESGRLGALESAVGFCNTFVQPHGVFRAGSSGLIHKPQAPGR